MRDGERNRVFDRANWQRKARPPTWFQRAEIEKSPELSPTPKRTEAS
jgi:hypothetical protein